MATYGSLEAYRRLRLAREASMEGNRLRFFAESGDAPLQYVVDVVNSTADIVRYAKAVTATNMPTMLNAPAWWSTFDSQWTLVKAHAQSWFDALEPSMSATIQSVIDVNNQVIGFMNTALVEINILIGNPGDAQAKQVLGKDLGLILTLLENTPCELDGFTQMLTQFEQQILADKAVLDGAVVQANGTIGADKDQIKSLQADIANLKDEIDKYNSLLKIEDIGKKAGIGIAVVGVVVGLGNPALGGVFIGVGIAMIGGSFIGTIFTDKAIASDEAKILEDSSAITALNTQIGVMGSVADDCDRLAALSAKAQSAAAQISVFWKEFTDDVGTFLSSVRNTEQDTDYGKAKTDMEAAVAKWNELQSLLAPLGKITFDLGGDPVILQAA